MRVVVLGAGVVGLLAAHALRHRGHEVEVVTRDDPADTTSAVAGASFKPRLVADSSGLRPLLRASRDVLTDWTRSGFAAALGIRRHRHVVATAGPDHDRPRLDLGHPDLLDEVTRLRPTELPPGARAGVSFTTWFFPAETTIAAMVDHLGADHHVAFRRQDVARLADLADVGDVVVNATGVAAATLVDDPGLVPVRGRVVRVRSPLVVDWRPDPPGDTDGSVSLDGAYVYPRADGVLVGGTSDWGEFDTTPDRVATRRLVDAAAGLVPALRRVGDDGLQPLAGLRPHRRGGVRVELVVDPAGMVVVHAYGHGGAGWTLAPGTARRVADLVDEASSA